MSSVVIAGDTSGTVTISAPAVAGTPTLTLPTTTGTIVATSGSYVPTTQLGSGTASSSNYLRGDQSWATISSGGMTLLGTLTTTSGTTQTLSSLTLTGYKQVQIVGSGISTTGLGGLLLGPNNTRLTDDAPSGASTCQLFAFVDLALGICTSSYAFTAGLGGVYVNNSGLSTASTSIVISLTNSTSFDAGTIKIYGVA
jgi:hypothetical protein